MMPRRLLFLLTVFAPFPLPAQEAKRSGFYLTTPVQMSYGREVKLPVGSRLIDDSSFLLTPPTFTLIGKSPRTDFSLSYEPEFELFVRNKDLNSWNHTATLRYIYKPTRRMTLEMGDSFLATEDAARQLRDGFFLLPRGRYEQNAGYLSLGYTLSPRTTLIVRGDNTFSRTRLPESPSGDSLDELSAAGTVSLMRQLGRNHRMAASYSLVKTRALGATTEEAGVVFPGFHKPYHSFALSYGYTLLPNMSIDFSGGVIRGTSNSYSGSARIERRFQSFRLAAGYDRQLSAFGGFRPGGGGLDALPGFSSGLLPNSMAEGVSLSFRGNIGSRVGIEGRGMGSRNKTKGLSSEIKSVAGRLRLDVKLTDRLIAFSAIDVYRQNLNGITGIPLARNRYAGGLEFVITNERIPRDTPPKTAGKTRAKAQ